MQTSFMPKFSAVINKTGNEKIDAAIKATQPAWNALQQQAGKNTDFIFSTDEGNRVVCEVSGQGGDCYIPVSYASRTSAQQVVSGALANFMKDAFAQLKNAFTELEEQLSVHPADIKEASQHASSRHKEDKLEALYSLVNLIPNSELSSKISALCDSLIEV